MAGQLWAVSTLGGYFYSQRLSQKLREAMQPMSKFRQFCDAKDVSAQGTKKGDTWTFDVVMNVATQGATLVETNVMPETNFTVAQVAGTVYEYGNSVPYSGKLEALSQFDVRKSVMSALSNDAAKVLDSAAFAQFALTPLRVTGTTSGGTLVLATATTVTASNTTGLYKGYVTQVRDTMVERNIPFYDGDSYVCVAHPLTLRPLKDDLTSIIQYTESGYRQILNGEIGKFDNVRFVEQTNITKGSAATADWTGALAGSKGSSWAGAKSNWALFFGQDTVMEGIAIPEETRAKIPTDYGRSKGVAWYAMLGYKIVHNWTETYDSGNTQVRIVAWDSKG
jgi:N4-gp56 family major capsid protein